MYVYISAFYIYFCAYRKYQNEFWLTLPPFAAMMKKKHTILSKLSRTQTLLTRLSKCAELRYQ